VVAVRCWSAENVEVQLLRVKAPGFKARQRSPWLRHAVGVPNQQIHARTSSEGTKIENSYIEQENYCSTWQAVLPPQTPGGEGQDTPNGQMAHRTSVAGAAGIATRRLPRR